MQHCRAPAICLNEDQQELLLHLSCATAGLLERSYSLKLTHQSEMHPGVAACEDPKAFQKDLRCLKWTGKPQQSPALPAA